MIFAAADRTGWRELCCSEMDRVLAGRLARCRVRSPDRRSGSAEWARPVRLCRSDARATGEIALDHGLRGNGVETAVSKILNGAAAGRDTRALVVAENEELVLDDRTARWRRRTDSA